MLLFSAGVSIFVIFLFFSFLVHKNLFTQFDFNTTVILQNHVPRRFDGLFSVFSGIGSVEPMSVVVLVLLVFFVMKKKIFAAVNLAFLFVVLHVIELYGKFFVSHRPPPEFMLRTKQLFTFPQFTVREQNSYPSGHAGRALFISTILIILIVQSKHFSPRTKFILCCLVIGYDVIMLLSRVYLGEHWTSDVVGGSLLGMSFGIFTAIFFLSNQKRGAKETVKEKKRGFLPKFTIEIKRVE